MTSQLLGIVTHGVQLGVQSVLFRPARRIGSFVAQVTIKEEHTDELEITDHPVEQGAKITDHSYLRPSELVIECAWSDSPTPRGFLETAVAPITGTMNGVAQIITGNGLSQSRDVYRNLLALQNSRTPIDVITGKRPYTNMLVRSIKVTTDKETENSLKATIMLRQVILVQTQILTVGAPKENQANPQVTQATSPQGTKQLTPAPNYNAGAGRGAINPTFVSPGAP